jgi:hypothetical protein
MNTSDTTERPCVEETSGSNRLCTVESIPALRTGFSEDLSERKETRSEKGELMQCTALEENKVKESIQMHLSHFEPEAANNKQTPLKLMVMKSKMLPEISMEPMRFARIKAKKSQMAISLQLKHCPFTKPTKMHALEQVQ